MATLKDKLGIPESYGFIDITIYCIQCLVYGIAWGWAYLSVAAGVVALFYIFAYLPLAWAVGHLLGLLNH